MDEANIYLDGAQRIMNFIRPAFGNLFNAYFIGAPDIIPEAALPCVIVQKISGKSTVGPTQTDDMEEDIMIHIVVNSKEGFGTPENDDTMMRQLFNLVEARDRTTGDYVKNSFMYVLRHNLTLGSTIINNDVVINYDATPRPDQPTILEAIIAVSLTERVIITGRT